MPSWVLEDKLARSSRPGYAGERGAPVSAASVRDWVAEVKSLGVRSIICLLGPDQLLLYSSLEMSLPDFCAAAGFSVEHVPVLDHKFPPLTSRERDKVWRAYRRLPKPVLVHCSAGVDRTGSAVDHICSMLKSEGGGGKSDESG
jgi:protein-tyrosine phosphatase